MIKVLFFAQLRDQLGVSELSVSSDENPNVQVLLNNLKNKDEQWEKLLSRATLMVAVNQTISNKTATLSSGDEVAFFPPVTGG
ncbi:molybdopterin converting factor subunit 1 [Psychromonas sp. Urea-02u-13]|uniref:molybdopterin converting factor subunit 1 n=1 Tax=Psychromonas sp. Urea-02u-13 TaxID=2058326 RepID=UPI000C31D722|nr:molybdopterin converting factor subunit 1 [Psychromonas sp. Urea-02u-13]PKG39308.1 molybdopterin converting factor subunit 1 [Psychromonas sp. Urea-02u-13]